MANSTSTTKNPTTLSDLPPELYDLVAAHLPTASSIASLGRTNKALHAYVEKDAWKTFARNRFPTLYPRDGAADKHIARTLTTLSRACDRRALVARYTEPSTNITAYPGRKKVDTWKRPKGQTIGFTPQLDVHEDTNFTSRQRNETLAFSAGAEICIRNTHAHDGMEEVKWTTYRPHAAREGRDDITALHLVRSDDSKALDRQLVLTGTANGYLQLLQLPVNDATSDEVGITYFATQGLPVRSTSIYQDAVHQTLLAANLGDVKVALYNVDPEHTKIGPASEMKIQPFLRADGHPAPNHRAWSTTFLSPSTLAIGVGPSETPVHVYQITESGLSQAPVRRFGLLDNSNSLEAIQIGVSSAVYTTVPLPTSTSAPSNGNVFFSGAYDGIVRLHDMRSNRDVEQKYTDPADDSAVYSILPRGQEKLMVGSSRHNILKIFDMRLGAKCYSYLDSDVSRSPVQKNDIDCDYNLFLRPNRQSFAARGSSWSQGRNRSAESSVYSISSPSFHSPYIYAGVENAIWSLAFTEVLDPHPDPLYFEPWSARAESQAGVKSPVLRSKDVLGLAMYDQEVNMKLYVQRSLWETWRACASRRRTNQPGLDERWKGANEFG